jgi:putative transposase
LSFRDVEDLLAERGIMVSYETVRRWVNHFAVMPTAQKGIVHPNAAARKSRGYAD